MEASSEGDRRWTAILSTDMVGFTQITQDIGNEKVYDLLQHVLGIARAVIEAHGGHVIDTAGDGLLASFGAPKALENASVKCCAAASAFRSRLASEQATLQAKFGVTPQFRSGLAGGDVMVAHQKNADIKVVGEAVNQAARLMQLAAPDEVLLTESMLQEIAGFVETTDRGETQIKGYDKPLRIHALARMQNDGTRFDGFRRRGIVALVSRQAELNQALAAFQSNAPAKMLLITGVAGVGKSRLTYEVMTRISRERPIFIGQCEATGQSLYGPVYDMLRQASGVSGSRMDVVNSLAHLCRDDKRQVLLQPTSALDAFERALRERELLTELLHGLYRTQNAIFVLEDAHWLDSATQDLLASLSDTPVPIIITARPPFEMHWVHSPAVDELPIKRLSDADISAMVHATMPTQVSPELVNLISERSEGVPLIAEEVTRALKHGGKLVETPTGLNVAVEDVALITGNLAQLVLSRVERLPDDQKASLLVAAAIGRDFSDDLLRAATGNAAPLSEVAGLIERRAPGQLRFAHALVRDAVYDSLLTKQRAQAHLQIAQALEQMGDSNFARLADHFSKAEDRAKAVKYLLLSAEDGLSSYALEDVDRVLTQAADFIDGDATVIDDQAFGDMSVIWVRALNSAGQFGRLRNVIKRILPRLTNMGNTRALRIVHGLYAIGLTHLRDYPQAEALAKQTLAEAEAENDLLSGAWGKVALMRIYQETSQEPPEVVERLAAEIEPVAKQFDDRQLAMMALYLLSAQYRFSGRRLSALAVADDIAKFAETHQDRRAKAYSSWARAITFAMIDDPEETRAVINIGRQSVISGSADDGVSRGILAFANTLLEPPDDVRAELDRLDAIYAELEDHNLIQTAFWLRSMLEFKCGRIALAWRLIGALIPDIETSGNIALLRHAIVSRADVLLGVGGLIDFAKETPEHRPQYPRDRPGFQDIIVFARLRIVGKRLAQADYEKVIALLPLPCGAIYARAKIGLGLIAASRGQKSSAANLLQQGYAAAEAEKLDPLMNRARDALARLGADVT